MLLREISSGLGHPIRFARRLKTIPGIGRFTVQRFWAATLPDAFRLSKATKIWLHGLG